MRARLPRTVLIDEIQRLPSLLNTVQSLLDDAKIQGQQVPRFLLTGASARKLRRGGANLLPGRVFTYHLGPLTSAELDRRVDTALAMAVGTLPEPYLEHPPAEKQKLLRSFAGSYLREEVQAEALTRSLESFSRFLDVAAANAGQSLDFSKLAARAKVARRSAMRYFEILEDSLLVRRVDPHGDLELADLVRHPKFYFFDPGVLNGLLGNFGVSGDRRGNLFEHLFVSQLWASAAAFDRGLRLGTLRTHGGLEVDFVVTLGGDTWLIEVKSTSSPQGGDIRPLKRAALRVPSSIRCILAHAGSTERVIDGVPALPWQKALAEMGL